MPLHLDLSSYQAEITAKDSLKIEQSEFSRKIASYSGAILKGIGHGIADIAEMVRDFGIYPILDAHIMLVLATHPDLSEIDANKQQYPEFYQGVQERMESRANTLYQISLLALDTGILWAKYDPQNPDVQEFQTLISVHPEVCDAAESRMHQRADNWSVMYQQFMESSSQDKVALVSEGVTTFLGPGVLLKSLHVISLGVRNLRDCGVFLNMPKFSTVYGLHEIKSLTHDCEQFLKFLEKIEVCSHISSFSDVSSDTAMKNGSVSTAFQESFKKHFMGMADSSSPHHEESAVNVSTRTSGCFLVPPSNLEKNLSLSRPQSHNSYEKQIQEVTTSVTRIELSTPTQWQSSKTTLALQIGTTFFSSGEKLPSKLNFNARKDVEGKGYLACPNLVSSHSVFSVASQQVQKTADNFQKTCEEMKMRVGGRIK